MTFNPNQQMVIDVDAKKSGFLVRCPIWANGLLANIPSKRWSKSARAWGVPIIKQNVTEIRSLLAAAGVVATEDAMTAINDHEVKVAAMKNVGEGFPAWYKFKTEPRQHQYRAINKCYGLNAAALFMDMQTGKSKTTIDLCVAHRMNGDILGVLILVKLTLRRNWIKQFEQHCPIDFDIYLPMTGNQKQFERWLRTPHDFKVMIAGWESLSVGGMAAMCEQFQEALGHTACIGDETTYITNSKAERTRRAVKLAHMSDYRYALTGTPATEGPMNLYSQFEFLDSNVIGIGDYYAFRNRYAVMGGYRPTEGAMKGKPTQIVGYQNLDELMELISPHTFQVTKDEAYDLPPKRYETREVQITKAQRDMYKKAKGEGVLLITGSEDHVIQNTLEVALRLHQITGGYSVIPREERREKKDGTWAVKTVFDPVHIVDPENNPKMVELMAVINEAAAARKKGIIWAVYMPEILDIAALVRGAGYRVGELHGGIPDPLRQPTVDAFERGELDWIVGNAQTASMGYTMQSAEVNIFYSNTFKCIDRLQAEDRSYGDGQTKSGIWIDIMAEKTVDVTIKRALDEKEDVQSYIKHRIREINKLLDGDE